jgi:NADH dehydrogenase
VALSGLAAKTVTRGYHLTAIPGNRVRIACDWLLDAVVGRQAIQFGLVHAAAVPLDADGVQPGRGVGPETTKEVACRFPERSGAGTRSA